MPDEPINHFAEAERLLRENMDYISAETQARIHAQLALAAPHQAKPAPIAGIKLHEYPDGVTLQVDAALAKTLINFGWTPPVDGE